jgi:hypothetical protein
VDLVLGFTVVSQTYNVMMMVMVVVQSASILVITSLQGRLFLLLGDLIVFMLYHLVLDVDAIMLLDHINI